MCGRYNILPDAAAILLGYGIIADLLREMAPRYNLSPGDTAPVIVIGEDAPTLAPMQWGFVPHWHGTGTPKFRPINAQSETAADKPYFRDAMQHSRCVVPASGFYEWKTLGKRKQPYHIHRPDQPLLLMAGLWSRWHQDEGSIDTFTLLTTRANALMQQIHDRMPVIVSAEDINTWLAQGQQELLMPCAEELLVMEKISTRVNNSRYDAADILDPDAEQDLFGD